MKNKVLFSLTLVLCSIAFILSSFANNNPLAGKTFIQQNKRGMLKEPRATNALDAYSQSLLDYSNCYATYVFDGNGNVTVTKILKMGDKMVTSFEYEVNNDELKVKSPLGFSLYKLEWLSPNFVKFIGDGNEEYYALKGSTDDFRNNPPKFTGRKFVSVDKIKDNKPMVLKFEKNCTNDGGSVRIYFQSDKTVNGYNYDLFDAEGYSFKNKNNSLYLKYETVDQVKKMIMDFSWIDETSFNARFQDGVTTKFVLN